MSKNRVLGPAEVAIFLESKMFSFLEYSVDSATFSEPSSVDKLARKLRILGELHGDDGEVDPSSVHAERYALCLAHEGLHTKAKAIYDTMTSDGLVPIPHDNSDRYMCVADQGFILGYRGLISYANVSFKPNPERSKEVLEHIKNPRIDAGPFGFRNVRFTAINLLVTRFDMPYQDDLQVARANQY